MAFPARGGKKAALWTGGILVALAVIGATREQPTLPAATPVSVQSGQPGDRAVVDPSERAAEQATGAPQGATPQPSDRDAAAEAKAAADAKATAAAEAKARAANATWAVSKVVDGDTIWVARGGVSRKVRLIGIDTPEIGECGYAEATRSLRAIIGGQRVTLTAGARDDVDQYGRLLRYVDVSGVDAGLRQIKRGYAVARYDSRDGYGRHARETAYVRADLESPPAGCTPPAAAGSGSGTGSAPQHSAPWPLAGDRYPCPQARPVKGNESSMIAHEPGDRYYLVTNPEQCFATMSDAIAAGFRPAKV